MTFQSEIAADVAAFKTWLDGVETWAEGLGLKIVLATWALVKGLAPGLLVEFQALAIGALRALGAGASWDAVLTAIKNGASVDLTGALEKLTAEEIQLLVALVQGL